MPTLMVKCWEYSILLEMGEETVNMVEKNDWT